MSRIGQGLDKTAKVGFSTHCSVGKAALITWFVMIRNRVCLLELGRSQLNMAKS